MSYDEAINVLEIAKAEVEWEYSLEIYCALDMAIDALIFKKKFDEKEKGVC